MMAPTKGIAPRGPPSCGLAQPFGLLLLILLIGLVTYDAALPMTVLPRRVERGVRCRIGISATSLTSFFSERPIRRFPFASPSSHASFAGPRLFTYETVVMPLKGARRGMGLQAAEVAESRAVGNYSGTVHIAKGKARLFYDGNPIIYPGAIQKEKMISENKEDCAGRLVNVLDHRGRDVGCGVYNPHSMYRVRMLSSVADRPSETSESGGQTGLVENGDEDQSDRVQIFKMVRSSILEALKVRQALGLPSKSNSAYRLLNGEGDGVSGLTVDVFHQRTGDNDSEKQGTVVVVMSAAYWVEYWKDVVLEALFSVGKEFGSEGIDIVWKKQNTALRKDGWPEQGENDSPREQELSETEAERRFTIFENGLKFWVDLESGQKTGFYLDQRDNRKVVRDLSAGKDVLDLFCYSGGFSIHAAAGGAKSVRGVDSSPGAIQLAKENALLNGLEDRVAFEKMDVFNFVNGIEDQSFDLVICDPPKFAPSRRDLPKATRRYIRLNSAVMKKIKPGGLLLTCTCSGAMSQTRGAFIDMLKSSAREAGRRITVIESRHAARDHLVHSSYPEGLYLTAVLVAVH
mmetsp:Transcript_34360/g.83148  ORF Transcript_34360/g.83148 Transcript_34360/m.83148 type:complete len:574 (+) Transcript_34360:30-1751(+)